MVSRSQRCSRDKNLGLIGRLAYRRGPACEERVGDDLPGNRRQEHLVAVPFQNVEIDRVLLARGRTVQPPKRSAVGRIDAPAVLFQPIADLPEPYHLTGLDLSVGHGPGIKCQVSIPPGARDQNVDALFERLHLVVGPPRPLRVQGHAGFPWAIELERPERCSGVSKSPGSPQRLLMISHGWSVRIFRNSFTESQSEGFPPRSNQNPSMRP